jgi:hypothetical protein
MREEVADFIDYLLSKAQKEKGINLLNEEIFDSLYAKQIK